MFHWLERRKKPTTPPKWANIQLNDLQRIGVRKFIGIAEKILVFLSTLFTATLFFILFSKAFGWFFPASLFWIIFGKVLAVILGIGLAVLINGIEFYYCPRMIVDEWYVPPHLLLLLFCALISWYASSQFLQSQNQLLLSRHLTLKYWQTKITAKETNIQSYKYLSEQRIQSNKGLVYPTTINAELAEQKAAVDSLNYYQAQFGATPLFATTNWQIGIAAAFLEILAIIFAFMEIIYPQSMNGNDGRFRSSAILQRQAAVEHP